MVCVTNWDKVSVDDFYLTDKDWIEDNQIDNIEELRDLAKNGDLFEAFEVEGDTYAVYQQMDAHQVFVDRDCDIKMSCESAVIGNTYEDVWKTE